jgi:hypothetical protein
MSSDEGKNESVSAADRRIASRYSTVKFVWYRILKLESNGENFPNEGISKTCDISETGIGLHAPRALPVGRMVFVEIATTEFNLSAIGKIIYSKPTTEGYHRIGVHFTIVPPNDRLLLMRHFGSHENA